jgi:alcohol dehydrogenase
LRANQKSLISDDGVGLSAVHIADALGANVVAVDVEQSKLDAAIDLGADETLDASDAENVGSEVKAIAGGGANVAVDALGIAETCRNALDSLGTHGQHLQIGLTTSDEGGQVPLPTDAMVMQEIDFLGSFGMPPNRYGGIFRMVERGTLDPGAIVSETVSLDQVPEKIAAMSDFDTVGIPVVTEF